MSKVTKYSGLGKIYFNKILREIIKIAHLNKRNINILDYGCGTKQLSKILKKKILNFDILEEYNEVNKLEFKNYDIIIFNHVLMYFEKDKILELFSNIKKENKYCEIVVGIGKQNLISKILKFISLNFHAHQGTKCSYQDQLDIINQMNVINHTKNIFLMTDIYYFNLFNYDKISKSYITK